MHPVPRLVAGLATAALAATVGCTAQHPSPPDRGSVVATSAATDTHIVATVPDVPAASSAPKIRADTSEDIELNAEGREASDLCHLTGAREGKPPVDNQRKYDEAAMRRGIPLRCVLRPGGQDVRLVVSGSYSAPMGVAVFDPPDARTPLQKLLLDNDEAAYEGMPLVRGVDLDGDGWTDLAAQTYHGSGGMMFDVFRYDPRQRRFVQDSELIGAGNIRPLRGRPGCISISWKTSAWDDTSSHRCLVHGAWTVVREEEHKSLRDQEPIRVVDVVRELRGGRMTVVHVDTT